MDRSFFIAGVQFHGMKTVIKKLDEGTFLNLVPEPENEYDPNAVAIKYNDVMLGYVPKTFSSEISANLELSILDCVIVGLFPESKPWEQCKVTVMDRPGEEE